MSKAPKGKAAKNAPPAPADDPRDAAQEALFREVDEDLRHDQLHRLWQRYGRHAIGAAVLLVVGVAGWQGYSAYERNQAIAQAEAYEAGLEALPGDPALAATRFAELEGQGGSGYPELADLQRAAALIEAGDRQAALGVYRDLADDDAADPALRDLAQVLLVLHQVDDGPPEALSAQLDPLTDPAGAWRHSALELQALLKLKAGEPEEAARRFADLTRDSETPSGVRERARALLDALGGDPDAGATPAGDDAPADQG
ncbi:tetratricopeptide repeat protein [Roseospirillum parvum]|uniref:Ancillary SecYEG translocon subunit/Cell division coordinator CpoB TPR domain-containing protein n=1 Tax=Roseospirillum parvum TaxID=83401 RepID=A0A1G7XX21_9PROT|nr:tetratricopeptide repeat protein [Roseospirillum parvum]SDG88576.1 hypothetical protein SAMN05421742_103122 [Roseospirillum parvum]